MNVDLQQVGADIAKGIRRVFRGIELELKPGKLPVDSVNKFAANGMQLYRGVATEGFDLLGLEEKRVIFIRERLDGFSQLLQSVFWQSRMTPSAGMVQSAASSNQNTSQEPVDVPMSGQVILVQKIQ
jgi:hypothetical protein